MKKVLGLAVAAMMTAMNVCVQDISKKFAGG